MTEVTVAEWSRKMGVPYRSRIPADAIPTKCVSAQREGMTPERALVEVSENYPSAGTERIRKLLDYYFDHQPQPQP